VKAALGVEAPPELDQAVLAPRPGQWELAEARLVLEKGQVKSASYSLLFRIEGTGHSD
jgi:hypothetical protein